MTKETKNNGHPEGGIYELFAYTLKLLAYPNNSHMNELCDMLLQKGIRRRYDETEIIDCILDKRSKTFL